MACKRYIAAVIVGSFLNINSYAYTELENINSEKENRVGYSGHHFKYEFSIGEASGHGIGYRFKNIGVMFSGILDPVELFMDKTASSTGLKEKSAFSGATGLDVEYVFNTKKPSVHLKLGYYSTREADLYQQKGSSLVFTDNKEKKSTVAVGLGITIPYDFFFFELGFHSIKGGYLSLGGRF